MSLQIGIVGMPNVGKSTLFNTLTKKNVDASNYPFCTIDPNVGVVRVPDQRLDKLAEISQPKKIIPAVVEFVDIAGLVAGASKGEGLGNKFLANIRECDAICEVVRDFRDGNVIHVDGRIDPESDRRTINLELILADLETMEKRVAKLSRETKSGDKEAVRQLEICERIKAHLENELPARELDFEKEDIKFVRSLNLLTIKPIIYVLNIDEAHAGDEYANWDGRVLKLNVKLESEIASLPEDEQAEYIQELGMTQSGLDKLIRTAYEILGLISFFTTGSDETRAWTIKKLELAPAAAGVIHTDFEKGFIRAEVMGWERFVEAGSEAVAREKGWMRTEGKDYVMQDGDLCNFLINTK